eukprot:g7990.t1
MTMAMCARLVRGRGVRGFFGTARVAHGSDEHLEGQPTVHVVFETHKGEATRAAGRVGESLLRVAQRHDVPLEGACECSVACSTCHVILEGDHFDSLPEPTEDEDDMLDMAFGLTGSSRLGCQVFLRPEDESRVVKLPAATRNFYVDGHVPQPH